MIERPEWNSEDETIATVTNDGTIKGINEGTTIITATIGEKQAESTVIVKERNPILPSILFSIFIILLAILIIVAPLIF